MWMLDFFPDVAIHILLVLGIFMLIAGFVMAFLPGIKTYKLPFQIIGILVTAFALYMEGGIANEALWQAEIDKQKAAVAEAEARAATATAQVVTKYVTKTQVIREQAQSIIQYVDREVVKIDTRCEIPPVVIQLHDAAARNQPLPQISEASSDLPAKPDTPVKTVDHNTAATNSIRMPKRSDK